MISFIVMVVIAWIVIKALLRSAPVYIAPSPQIVIHLHQPQIVVVRRVVDDAN